VAAAMLATSTLGYRDASSYADRNNRSARDAHLPCRYRTAQVRSAALYSRHQKASAVKNQRARGLVSAQTSERPEPKARRNSKQRTPPPSAVSIGLATLLLPVANHSYDARRISSLGGRRSFSQVRNTLPCFVSGAEQIARF